MSVKEFDIITGASSHTGKYLTFRLLQLGHTVRALTNSIQQPKPTCSQLIRNIIGI
jgi:nucleoside-diphosphate-sugar epimerase